MVRSGPWRVAVAAAAGLALCGLYVARYPPAWPAAPSLSAPDFDKALAALHALLALAVVNLAALGWACPLVRLWRDPQGRTDRLVQLTLGLFAMAHVFLFLGLAGFLSARSVGLATLLPAIAGLLSAARGVRGGVRLELRRVHVAWVLAGLGLWLSLLSAFVPLYGWDALTYHLALPERFLRTGSIRVDPFSIFSTFPLLTQMLYTQALALAGPMLAKLVHLEFGVLALLALGGWGRRAGAAAGVFAMLALLSDPLFLWETTIAYSDLSLALLVVLSARSLLEWDAAPSASLAWRTAVLAGLCAAIRYPGLFVPLGLALAIALGGRAPRAQRLRLAALVGVCAAAFLAPWLLRNFAASGSPSALELFDPLYRRQMVAFHDSIGMGHGLAAFLAAPWNVTLRTTPGLYSNSFGFQVGFLYLLGAVLALVAGRARPGDGVLWRAAGVLFASWFFSAQEARYLLPCFLLVVPIGAGAVQSLHASARGPWRAALWAAPVVALACGQAWIWRETGPAYRMALGDMPWAAIERTPAEDMGRAVRALPEPPRGRVLLLFEAASWSFRGVDTIPYHFYQGAPTLVAVHRALAAGKLCGLLRELRVSHVVVNAATLETFHPQFVEGYSSADYEADLRGIEAFLAASARPLAQSGGSTLLALAGECREVEARAR